MEYVDGNVEMGNYDSAVADADKMLLFALISGLTPVPHT